MLVSILSLFYRYYCCVDGYIYAIISPLWLHLLKSKKLCQSITIRIPTSGVATVIRTSDVPADAPLVLLMMRVQNRGNAY